MTRSAAPRPRCPHVLLAVIVGIGGAPWASAQVFVGPTGTPTGNNPVGVAAGDVDHDGAPDAVLALVGIAGFAVQRGNGAGGFHPAVVVPALDSTTCVTLVDLNGDGQLDVVTATPNVGKVQAYLNSNGNYGASVDTFVDSSAAWPFRLASADFNLDGVPDLAVSKYYAGKVTVMYGQGNGNFVGLQDFNAGGSPSWIVAVGVDADAYPDLVVGLDNSSTFLVLTGTNVGTFIPQNHPAGVPSTALVSVGDFNEDSKVDVIVSGAGTPTSCALVPGTGNGSFGAPATLPIPGSFKTVVGDFDHDGHLDVVASDFGQVEYLRGQGTGVFYAPVAYTGNFLGIGAGAADLASDGRLDLLVADWATSTLYVFAGNAPVSAFATPYGTGTPGCYGKMGMRTRNEPVINNPNFGFTCTNVPRRSVGLCLVTDQQQLVPNDPFALGVGMHVGFLTTEIYTFDAYSDLAGTSFAPAPLPNAPAIVGLTYYAQTLWFEQPMDGLSCSTSPFDLVSSRGLGFTIQPAGPP